TQVFYCDPMASYQKPQVERNHEFIRLVLPQGTSFDTLTQSAVDCLMSHINSYSRKGLGDKSPFEMFAFLYGDALLEKLLLLVCQQVVPHNNIILKPSLLK
ncbi:MAG: IS30 family transposase, partial [Clostridia bacterium]